MEKVIKKFKLFAGKKEIANPGKIFYTYRGDIEKYPVYFLIAGMVRQEYNLPGEKQLDLYLQPGTIFGLEESLESKIHLSRAIATEKSLLYKWDVNSFFNNTDEAMMLAILTIRSLSHLIRILNAEYGEQLIINRNIIESTLEENRLDRSQPDPGTLIDTDAHHHLRQIFHDKQILIREGEIQRQIFWILNGEVFITKYIDYKHKILAKLGKGELIGEMSFFDKSLTSATVIANGEVQVLVFDKKDFREIFFTNSMWKKRLLYSLSARIVSMIRKLYLLRRELAEKK